MNTCNAVLARNNCFYNWFLKNRILDAQKHLDKHEIVARIMFLARFAWRNHAGYYFDGRLENLLASYGRDLETYVDKERTSAAVKELIPDCSHHSVLHLATELFSVGGHTRVLYQILKRNEDTSQIVVLTGQPRSKIPQWFLEGIGSIPVISLASFASVFERAAILRQIATCSQKVISYHHPFDAVPVIAFFHNDAPPVLFENHAHSWFWLGSSIADLVFTHSGFHKEFTLKTRPVEKVHLLPVTQIDAIDTGFDQDDKRKAKQKLGINPNGICLITLGTSEKFIPNAQYDFFKTADKFLQRFKNAELFILGISADERETATTGRIHFLGPVSDPSDYYKAADICLDALPQPSLGAAYYAALVGLACPFYKYGESNIFNCRRLAESALYTQHVGTPHNEDDYLDKLGFLIEHPAIRLEIAHEMRTEYLSVYSDEKLASSIRQMLDEADRLEHRPHLIPDGVYRDDADSVEIAEASQLQDLSATLSHFDRYLKPWEKVALLMQLAFKPGYLREVMQLVQRVLKNRLTFFEIDSNRRFHGSYDRLLSASVSSRSGK